MPLTYREALKLIRKHGDRFIRHGANHDIFITVSGEEIQVPRHPGTLSSGVERSIKKKLGLK